MLLSTSASRTNLLQARAEKAVVGQVCTTAYQALMVQQQRLNDELAKAVQYVQALLPPRQTGCIETDWIFRPSAELGGDAFGYHWLDDEHFALYLFDVTDHGIGSALHSVSVLNVLRNQALRGVDFRQPGAVLAALNDAFPMKQYNNLYFTIWYGVFNRKTRQLTYATGGHPPALLVNHTPEGLEAEQLRTQGLLIGGVPEVTYPVASRILPAGSTLYLFSDGVYEVKREDGSMLDLDAFLDMLVGQVHENSDVLQPLMDQIDAIRNCTICDDDAA
ncbi:MAG TPA: PP2C family protein-serine/threonine phosphatase, partial [Rhodothermales bacterium]|nr:PP2C family protein-serine/threonine phosphatase [Rhodothermales bacterium]